MNEKSAYFEYSDGSYLEAKVVDGQLVECPVIKISPPEPWGGGAMDLDGAIEFLTDIKRAIEETKPRDEPPKNLRR